MSGVEHDDHDDHDDHAEEGIPLLGGKIASLVGLLIYTAIFALLPVVIPKFRGNATLMWVSNSFAGGLLLGLTLLVLFPETEEEMTEYKEERGITDLFPWNYFSALMAFTLIMLIGKIALTKVATSYAFAFGMGIHALMAGLALGIESESSMFVGLLIAIIAHKWAESIAVGIRFAKVLPKEKEKELTAEQKAGLAKDIRKVSPDSNKSKFDQIANANPLTNGNQMMSLRNVQIGQSEIEEPPKVVDNEVEQ